VLKMQICVTRPQCVNIETLSSLHVMDRSQMVIPCNLLFLHLFGIAQMLQNVIATSIITAYYSEVL